MEGFAAVIDYSEHEREKAKFILKKLGMENFLEIKSINEYGQALGELSQTCVIIMDITFPSEVQGLEVLYSIRRKIGSDIPILITTKSDNMEYKTTALKYGANDYIIKPYDTKRLTNSVKSVIKLDKKFIYPTESISDYQISFEAYWDREMKIAERQGKPLSIILLTPLAPRLDIDKEKPLPGEILMELCTTPGFREKVLLRSSDTIFFNTNGDVLFVLPFTRKEDSSGVSGRIRSKVDEMLKVRSINFGGMFFMITVTYPDDGDSFQTMMESAYKHISDKQLLDRIASIPINTRKLAKKRYGQFNRWF